MARDHARIQLSIWDDGDFLALNSSEQQVYFAILSSKGLSRCGVVDYIPTRFEHISADMTAIRFRKSVKKLIETRFFVLDSKTQELLVRSYVRADGVFDRVNMGKAVGTAYEAVVSRSIRAAIGAEMARFMRERPDLPGWVGLAATSPEAHAIACGME